MSKIRVQTLTCPKCGDEIYSRARHDFHYCSCGEKGIFVDGGFDYLRYGWANDIKRETIKIRYRFVNATKAQLYYDWNFEGRNGYGKAQFGRIEKPIKKSKNRCGVKR